VRDLGNGGLARFGDAEGFIERALQLARDDGLRAQLGRAARTTAEGIDWERVNDAFAAALLGVWRSAQPVQGSVGAPALVRGAKA